MCAHMKMEICIYLCAYASEYVCTCMYVYYVCWVRIKERKKQIYSLCVSFYSPSFTRQLSAECFLLISLVLFNVFFLIKWRNN